MHANSVLMFREYGVSRIAPRARVLEIGPDSDPSLYRREINHAVQWETADLLVEGPRWTLDGSTATILMESEYEIPVADCVYDVVIAGQVIEHVREPWTWMRELARVVKPGGQVITISPLSWGYHEAPVDCWRIYPDGMKAVVGFAGMELEFSWFGTLERGTRRPYPGNGAGPRGPSLPARLVRRLGWPMPVAHDLIAVARKPTE